MALDSWNEIDDFKLDDEEYYCAFLDILGYKNKSDLFFKGEYNLQGRLERALSITMDLMKTIDNMKFVNMELIDVQFFSDSIIITHPKNKNTSNALFNILQFCSVLSAHLSFEELLVRGGISQGKHIKKVYQNYGFSFLSSKALEKSYVLESQKAIYPRILIDDDIAPSITEYLKTLVIYDGDKIILHFAPQLINKQGENLKEVFLELSDIYKTYENEQLDRVKQKYHWLLSYYYWTLTTTCNVDINDFSKFNVGSINEFKKF